MTPKELKDDLKIMVCPKHGLHPQIKIVGGKPQVYLCCCHDFREYLNGYINDNINAVDPLKPRELSHLTDEQYDKAIKAIYQIRTYLEESYDRVHSRGEKWTVPSYIMGNAKRAYLKIAQSDRATDPLMRRLKAAITNIDAIKVGIQNTKKQSLYRSIEDKEVCQKKHSKLKANCKNEAEEKKADRKRLAFLKKNRLKWTKAINGALSFSEKYPRTMLAEFTIEQLKSVLELAQKQLKALMPLRQAYKDGLLQLDITLQSEYGKADDKVNEICQICTRQIDIKTKTPTQKKYEKQRENKHEDFPYFRKMSRLYDYKLNSTDAWYENETREFPVGKYIDVLEYLEAYGRIIRGGISKADIVIEGEEDVDKWGYFKLSDKFLPFCLREVKVHNGTIVYHLYTFSTQSAMRDYDYDEAITDRIYFLTEKGIIK